MCGPKKGLKTSTIVDLSISLATGLPFLGRFPVTRQCKVFLMNGESGMSTLKATAHRICKSKDIPLASLDNLLWHDTLPRLDDTEDLETIEKLLQEIKCEVWIVDPAYLAFPGEDAGNLMTQGRRLVRVSEMCQRLGITWILRITPEKSAKTNDGKPLDFDLDKMAWAGFAEFARQWLALERRERYVSGSGEHKLLLDVGGSAGHGGCYALDISEGSNYKNRSWQVSISSPDEAREEKKENTRQKRTDNTRKKILIIMDRFPHGETRRQIGIAAGVSNDQVSTAVDLLVGEGVLARCKVKKNGAKYDGFKLASQAAT